jgi:large subunit ribosomal protein L23
MALFGKKTEDKTEKQDEQVTQSTEANDTSIAGADAGTVVMTSGQRALVIPRLSEKASLMARLNKYVFKVEGKINKVELRKAIEKAYGVKVANINMVSVKGKYRRYGRNYGRTSDFKKAIVTLTSDSKKLNLIEGAGV